MVNDIVTESKRVRLRHFTIEDLNLIAPLFADPDFMRYQYGGIKNNEESKSALKRILERYKRDGIGPWALERKTDGKFLGFCGLPVQIVDENREVEIGYGLAKEFWGLGYATEGTIACRDYAFGVLNLKRLISIIVRENVPSIGVALRTGMTFEKTTLFYGREVEIYSISRS